MTYTSTALPFAVVGDGHLITSGNSRPYPTGAITNVTGLAMIALAKSLPLRALWILPGSDIDQAAHTSTFWENPNPSAWRVFATGTMEAVPSTAAVRQLDNGKRGREVMIYGDVADRWGVEVPVNLPSSFVLVLSMYEQLMGGPAGMSPANTALNLLLAIHGNCDRAAWIKPLSRETFDQVPFPPQRAPAHANPYPIDGKYVHVYDKRSAYMASAMGKMGQGDPVRYADLHYDPSECAQAIKAEIPGLWCISARPSKDMPIGNMPSPFNVHEDLPDHEWYWTPQVKLAGETLGYSIDVHDAWIWPKHHTTLLMWVQRLWQARQAAHSPLVEQMIKSSFTQALGVMARIPGPKETIQHYHRPDWAGMLTAQNYLRQVKLIQKLEEKQPCYLAVATDSIALISDDSDPLTAFGTDWMGKDGAIGQYRVVASYDGERAQALISAARDGRKAAMLYKMMEEWDEEDGEDL